MMGAFTDTAGAAVSGLSLARVARRLRGVAVMLETLGMSVFGISRLAGQI
jgi:hypothetical protein